MMGDKAIAKDTVKKAGVPIVPGSDGPVDSESEAVKVARKIGYPVIIKAVAGGGGRGMRIAHNDVSFAKEYHVARNEAEKAFGNGQVYIEKYIEKPWHIEFQILADSHGKVLHLGERALFGPAPSSEVDRRVPFSVPHAGPPEENGKSGGSCGGSGGLRERRNDRVPRRCQG